MRLFFLLLLWIPSQAFAQGPSSGEKNGEPTALSAALEKAVAGHETAAIANQRITRARALRREALAGMLPSLSVGASGTYNGVEVELNGRNIVNQFDWSANGRASLTVFDGQLYPLYRASSRNLDATQADADWAIHQLRFEVEQAFLALAAAERELAIATRAVELRKSYTEQATALAEQGIALPLDVSRAEAQQLQAEQDVLEARARVGAASDALCVLMGIEPKPLSAAHDAGQRGLPPATAQIGSRLDFQAHLQRVEAAALRESAIWWSLLPTVELNADSRLGPSSLSNPDGFVWSVSLGASWLLYDGGARYARAESLAAETEILRLEQTQRERSADAEARRALRDWQTAHEAIQVASRQKDVAQQTYDMVLARSESGLATSIEVIEASEDLYLAEINLNASELAVDLAAATYRYVIGVPK